MESLKKETVLIFWYWFKCVWDERQRNGFIFESKVPAFHAEEAICDEEGVCVLRTAFNPIWLGHNGSEEQWEIMLKMHYGRGVESCTWQTKETTVLVQIRTGL